MKTIKKLILYILLTTFYISFGQKTVGNKTIEGNLIVTGNVTIDGSYPSSGTHSTDSTLIASKNLFNASLIQRSTLVSNTTGVISSSGSWDASGRQRVEPNTRYYITYSEFPTSINAPVGALRAYYDIEGNFVNWSSIDNEADGSFITPANVYYAQWSINAGTNLTEMTQLIKADDLETPIVLDGSRYVTTGNVFYPLRVNVIDGDLRNIYFPLYGKKWLLLGDSVTFQGKYIQNTQRVTGLIPFLNYGYPGRLIGDMASTDLTQSDVDEADVITLLGGTNNYGLSSSPLGTIADDSTTNSFYGKVRKELEIIYGFIETSTLSDMEKSEKLVVFITPTARGTAQGYTPPEAGGGGKTLLQIRNAIIEVCAEFGTPVFDAYALSGLNHINISRVSDELHPDVDGSLYGYPLGRFLNFNAKTH